MNRWALIQSGHVDRTDMVDRVNIEQDVIERLTEMALIDSVVVVMSEE